MTDIRMTEERVAEIVDRHAARVQGPYQWVMSTKRHEAWLESSRSVVMSFVRWGMTGAVLCFLGDRGLVKAEAFAVQRQKNHIGFDLDIDHPDAQGIAHSWQDVDDLLKDRDALLSTIAALKEATPPSLSNEPTPTASNPTNGPSSE
jgi:hypothetical protein